MSAYRPYIEAGTFHYPIDVGGSSAVTSDESFDPYVHIDLADIVAGQSRLVVVVTAINRFYARMLVAQPFEVARFLLQVGEWDEKKQLTFDDYNFDENSDSSDEDVDYFIDVRESSGAVTEKPTRVRPAKTRSVQLFTPNQVAHSAYPRALVLQSGPYIFSMVGALSDRNGLFGLWRALNASCLCRAASGVVNAWTTSFLASAFGLPDPQFENLLNTSEFHSLLAISVGGCALAAALLTPLYMIRARLMATSSDAPLDRPRSLRQSLWELVYTGQLVAPWWVIAPTTLAASVQHVVETTAPIVLHRIGGWDAFSTPLVYQIGTLAIKSCSLLIKLPLETMANRAQVKACRVHPRNAIVQLTDYPGIFKTVWRVSVGEAPVSSLYRGWRSEVTGLLGEWGYNVLDVRQDQQEHF